MNFRAMPSQNGARTDAMRLTDDQIKTCLYEVFGKEAIVYLFGSRVDPKKRGGVIDLYVAVDPLPDDWMDKEQAFWLCLQNRLGEQKIDIVIARKADRPIERAARQTGVML